MTRPRSRPFASRSRPVRERDGMRRQIAETLIATVSAFNPASMVDAAHMIREAIGR